MKLKTAQMSDLPRLKEVYTKIIEHMNDSNIRIWDDIYPCEFFQEDIENNRLYLLTENDVIVSAFALLCSNPGADCVSWENNSAKALYIDRLGVNVNWLRKGIGSLALKEAIGLAGKMGADYLRLFVVDINKPAENLYLNNGFKRADGSYEEVIEEDLVLHEIGYEISTTF